MKTRLDQFDAEKGLDRGQSKAFEAVWYLLKCVFFLSALPWPMGLKRFLLRAFGAKMGEGVVIKPRVNVHFPWKLEVGDHSWIGEKVFILNFEPVKIGAHACISQRAFLCTGNHDYRDPHFSYRNAPITIGSGAWIGAGVFVGPGVEVGDEAVAVAGSVITRYVPANTIVAGNPASERGPRWKSEDKRN
ncbi:MAG: WcaF family extracellular polysaccharide biosynthesis acetyltransferase [Chthoniobacterales bacterium]